MRRTSDAEADARRAETARLHALGLSTREIADRLGVTPRTVLRYKHDLDIEVPNWTPLSEEELQRAKQMLVDGYGYSETARTLGRNSSHLGILFPGYGLDRIECAQRAELGRAMARLNRRRRVIRT